MSPTVHLTRLQSAIEESVANLPYVRGGDTVPAASASDRAFACVVAEAAFTIEPHCCYANVRTSIACGKLSTPFALPASGLVNSCKSVIVALAQCLEHRLPTVAPDFEG